MTVLSSLIINNYTVSLANNQAKIIAFCDGIELPPQTVQAFITATSQSDKYCKQHPAKSYSLTIFRAVRRKDANIFPAALLAIFPWISVLFTSIFIVIHFMAA
jgi:hypothetical protein